MNNFADGGTFVAHHLNLLWHLTQTHLALTFIAVAIALAIALPVGVVLGHIHRGSFAAINISNFGRALPSLAVLSILLPLVGFGRTNNVITLVILAVPPILTNTYTAVDQVDGDAVEAAKGMGMRPLQVLTKVELPLAVPLIFAGIRVSVVFVIATATLAGFFGGGGLGNIIYNESSYHLTGVIGASYVVIALALLSQVVFKGLEYAVTPRALRKGTRRPGMQATQPLSPNLLADQPA